MLVNCQTLHIHQRRYPSSFILHCEYWLTTNFNTQCLPNRWQYPYQPSHCALKHGIFTLLLDSIFLCNTGQFPSMTFSYSFAINWFRAYGWYSMKMSTITYFSYIFSLFAPLCTPKNYNVSLWRSNWEYVNTYFIAKLKKYSLTNISCT